MRLKVIQIGYGYWGSNLARQIMGSDRFTLRALCDLAPERLAAARAAFGDRVVTAADYRPWLDDPETEAVVLAAQTEFNRPIAEEVLKAGKHLFIEKPLADTVEDGRAICAAARAGGLTLHCDHIMVFHPIIRHIKKIIDSGEMGDLMYYEMNRANLGPIRSGVNAMKDLAVHDLAVIDHLIGGSRPDHISAIGENFYGPHESLTYLIMKYGKMMAHIKSSWVSPVKERRMVIGGTKKMLVFDDLKTFDKLSVFDHTVVPRERRGDYGAYEYEVRNGDITVPYIQAEDALRNSLEHFAGCVRSGRESLAGPRAALRVLGTMEEAMNIMAGPQKSAG